MTEPIIQTLGRYTLHAELGKDGFATVYRAMDSVLDHESEAVYLHGLYLC
jgi:hypothetical protein